MTDSPEDPVAKKKPKKAKKPSLSIVEKTTLEAMLLALNEEYAVILRGSQVLVMRHWIGEAGGTQLSFFKKQDFLLYQQNNKLWKNDDDGPSKPIKVAQVWLEWPKRKTYEEVYFEPRGPLYDKRYNLWSDFAYKPKEAAGKFDLLLDHIFTNICQGDKSLYDWLMAWLADLFQNPAQKPGTALILRGGMGVGKGAFAHHIGKLLGVHYMSITQPSQLTGKFNGHMMDKLLMFVDEGWWSDERNGAGVLNTLITETVIAVEMKGKDVVFIPNFTRFIIVSNADRIVQTGLSDERRMAIFDVANHAQQNHEYFRAIDDQLKTGGYEVLLYYLLNLKYDKNLPRTIPRTKALEDHRLYSMPEEIKWLQECLIMGKIGDFRLTDNMPCDNDIEADKFYFSYIDYCTRMKVKPIARNILPKKLKQFIHLNKVERWNMSNRAYFYELPTLATMKANFEYALDQKIDWN